MYATASVEADVMNVLRKFADAYASRDKRRLVELFCQDQDVVLLGNGCDERNVGINAVLGQIRRDWEQTDTLRMRFGWRSVSTMGQVAWLATDCYLFVQAGYRRAEIPLRITAVMLQAEDGWKIAQLHYSSPITVESDVDTCLE
ncbi:hypothetical protein DTL21_17915 [Bremerella cremea]|uniref:SnoaL-like domain-containing protein n=1 Tax=Blastopirellula marina TaxID=124 RepID=A0A2S8FIX1_9BACT|nr:MULTISPECIES: nuclear transport factor 2 family protein [Pirellulaceae]PQO32112.1 hypothetical protein C5Y83_17900 [Blastopirellula marina]RCS45178.1 hypothetical protein DTL21_17915 [Bremerella cremea]